MKLLNTMGNDGFFFVSLSELLLAALSLNYS